MKVVAKDIREPLVISIKGDEPWLGELYASFLGKEGYGLEGKVTIAPLPYGVFKVEGDINFVPIVGCSRCDREIPWPIARDVSVRFIDRDAAEAAFDISGEEVGEDEIVERDLTPQDLDTYYLSPNGEIDVEMVLNDIVQTALPTRLIALNKDGKSCRICLDNVETPLVHKDEHDPEMSPFAMLKNLKLDN